MPKQLDRPELSAYLGDITESDADAIVNAANESLLGGGGVDGAIHRAAGPELLEACRTIGGCPTGEARITPGFNLRARWVIHTVGPVWQGGTSNEAGLLASCYQNCLKLASSNAVSSIAFPAISTGVYGFPKDIAARLAVDTVATHAAAALDVRFVCFDRYDLSLYEEALADI